MAIFDKEKMEQKPVYPTKQTPSYADWVLFNMGKELEEAVEHGGGGTVIVDQEVIAGSPHAVSGGAVKTYVDTEVAGINEVPVSSSSDADKVLTVGADGVPIWVTPSSGGGGGDYQAGYGISITNGVIKLTGDWKYVDEVSTDDLTISPNRWTNVVLQELPFEYYRKDIIVFITSITNECAVKPATYEDSNQIKVSINSKSAAPVCELRYVIYAKDVDSSRLNPEGVNIVTVLGIEGENYGKLPSYTLNDRGKILALSNAGILEWQTPSGGDITIDQTVIAGSTNPVSGAGVKTYVDTEIGAINEVPASTSADASKVLTVDSNGVPNWATSSAPQITVDQNVVAGSTNPVSGGGVKTYVDAIAQGYVFEKKSTIDNIDVVAPLAVTTFETLSSDYNNKDVLVIFEYVTPQAYVQSHVYDNVLDIISNVYISGNITKCKVIYSVFSRPKAETLASITIIGCVGEKYNRVPDIATTDTNKVLTVGSDGTPSWEPISSSGITAHTYNNFNEMVTDLVAHPTALVYCDTRIDKPSSESGSVSYIGGFFNFSVNTSGEAYLRGNTMYTGTGRPGDVAFIALIPTTSIVTHIQTTNTYGFALNTQGTGESVKPTLHFYSNMFRVYY